jgi:hypothetical protein
VKMSNFDGRTLPHGGVTPPRIRASGEFTPPQAKEPLNAEPEPQRELRFGPVCNRPSSCYCSRSIADVGHLVGASRSADLKAAHHFAQSAGMSVVGSPVAHQSVDCLHSFLMVGAIDPSSSRERYDQ